MDPPAITRHRRPFLAPLWLTLLAIVVVGAGAVTVYRSATTTVVLLVRPVEKQPGSIDDPPLSPEGEQRAQRLAQMFGDASAKGDRKSTRLNSSHSQISYAVFCLKKKKLRDDHA